MGWRTGLAALTAMMVLTSGAMADCRTIAFRFHPEQNDSVSTTGVSTGGAACTHAFGSKLRITSHTIAQRPAHGTLEIGPLRARYRPAHGFKGVDQYAIRICGTGSAGTGCSTITYHITVE